MGVVVLAAAGSGRVSASGSRLGWASGELGRPSAQRPIVGRAITLPPALFEAGAVGSGSLVTPAQAAAVVRALWQRWETALITSDTRALTQLVAQGPLLSAEISECVVASTRCVYETSPRPIRGIDVVVPLQHQYPIHFLAETETTDTINESDGLVGEQPWVELQILTKVSAQAPWKLSFDSGYSSATASAAPSFLPFAETPAGPTVAAGGQDLYNPPPQRPPPIAPNRFLQVYAAYLQSYKDTGHAPAHTMILPDGSSNGAGQQLASARQGSVYLGYRRHYQLTPDPGAGEWEFAVTGSAQMICGSIRDTETDIPLQGLLYQNPAENNWGLPLPTGNYLQISLATEHETCIYVVQGGLDAVGNNTYTFRVTGKRASSDLVALETDYGVLAAQIHQYATKLTSCEKAHLLAPSCTKQFAASAEQQFAQFYRLLIGSDQFPARLRGKAAQLAATARQLTLLSAQLASHGQTTELTSKIETNEKNLSHQYKTLAKDLS
jgi:hypothetical protein